jgi:tripartite-type tricarboxylate transporter receptor subunit TctC
MRAAYRRVVQASSGVGIVAGLAGIALPALAQEFPSKPIRIVTAAAGGGSDFIARLLAQGIAGPLGQPVVVENRGTGMLAGEVASRAPADGYNLTVQGGAFWIGPLLRKAPYDPIGDFTPISLIVREVNVLAVNPNLPVKSVPELIAYAKANPGKLNYSSPGVGSTTHLATELLNSMAGTRMIHVPYQGNQKAIAGVMAGEVQLAIFDAGLLAPFIQSGKLRALGSTSLDPSPLAPGMPTIASQGLPGFESIGLTGVLASGKVSPAIITRLNQEIVRYINRPEVKEQFLKSGVELVGSTPEQFAQAMRDDRAKMGKLITDLKLKIE